MKEYARRATPLTQLLRGAQEFHWNRGQQEAFKDLRDALVETAWLRIPRPEYRKELETDASNYAVGACLYQVEDDGQRKPVAYRSRKLFGPEERYQVHDKELLAIVKALKDWRVYLQGGQEPIKIYTDHKNLWNFATTKELNQRQVRWAEELADFEFKIHYQKGSENAGANTLSQRPDLQGVE